MTGDDEISNAELARWMHRIEQALAKIVDDHEQRLRTVERRLWIMTGVASAGVVTSVGAVLDMQGVIG